MVARTECKVRPVLRVARPPFGLWALVRDPLHVQFGQGPTELRARGGVGTARRSAGWKVTDKNSLFVTSRSPERPEQLQA
jgi:hypothetical protein